MAGEWLQCGVSSHSWGRNLLTANDSLFYLRTDELYYRNWLKTTEAMCKLEEVFFDWVESDSFVHIGG
jgi:hypothetical protein